MDRTDSAPHQRALALWHQVLEHAARAAPPSYLERLERLIHVEGLQDGTLFVRAPQLPAHERESTRALLERWGRAHRRPALRIELRAEPSPVAESPKSALPLDAESDLAFDPDPCRLGGALNRRLRFDTWVVGLCNRLATAAARAILEDPGRCYNPLYLHGGIGLGKTHLLQAIVQQLREARPSLKALYCPAKRFVDRFIKAGQERRLDEFRRSLRDLDLLALDDAHLLARKEWSLEEFFQTLNELIVSNKAVVVSALCPPGALSDFPERLVSRLKSGLVAGLDLPTYETRVSFVRRKVESLSPFPCPDEVAALLSEKLPGAFRELEGAITQLLGLASLKGQAPDARAALRVLEEFPVVVPVPVGLEAIFALLEDRYGVSRVDLASPGRERRLSWPRQIAMHLIHSLTGRGLKSVGECLGGRDHKTVSHGIRKVEARLREDAEFTTRYRRMQGQLSRRVFLISEPIDGENPSGSC